VRGKKNEPSIPSAMNKDYAYWLGLIYGDGSVGQYTLSYFSIDQELREYFVSFCKNVLSLKTGNYWQNKIEVFSVTLCYRLKKLLFPFPNFLQTTSMQIKAAFLRGFFDADGTVWWKEYDKGNPNYGVALTQKERLTLEKTACLLKNVFHIDGRIHRDQLVIKKVGSIIRFYHSINFSLRRKRIKLHETIKSILSSRLYTYPPSHYSKTIALSKVGMPYIEISRRLNIPYYLVCRWINRFSTPVLVRQKITDDMLKPWRKSNDL